MSSGDDDDEVLVTSENGVTTLTMNRPARLNAWTQSMRDSLTARMKAAAADDATKVAVITGKGKYYREVLYHHHHHSSCIANNITHSGCLCWVTHPVCDHFLLELS